MASTTMISRLLNKSSLSAALTTFAIVVIAEIGFALVGHRTPTFQGVVIPAVVFGLGMGLIRFLAAKARIQRK